MKLTVILNNRLPTKRAYGLQVVKMCEAFANNNAEVELIMPNAPSEIEENVYSYYKVRNNFSIQKKWCLDIKNNYRIRYLTFLISLIFSKINRNSFIFTRHPEIVLIFSLLGYRIIFELHNWLEQSKGKRLFLIRKSFFIVATTRAIKGELAKNGFNSKKVVVAPNGVDLRDFDLSFSKEDIRAKLKISLDKIIILYSGHLNRKKGVYTIVKATRYLPDKYQIIFVGGLKGDIEKLKQVASNCQNIKILGSRKYSEIPLYLKAADILIIANSGVDDVEKNYTAPLKLFEYLAAGRIIIASDVPAIREFLDDNAAVLVDPDNALKLADAIQRISNDPEKQKKLIFNSLELAKKFTWQKRAEKIINFINIYGSH
ncbi:glycosyltransferase family 4 protein [Candidatus Parcubacteria bacterium]|nr:glycosyltransferase family 4 protein [Candidatus Parcubacteria bacterium]